MFPNVPKGSQMFPKIPKCSQRCPKVPKGSPRFPKVPKGSKMFPNVPKGSQRCPEVPKCSQRFPNIPKGSQRFPKIPKGTQRFWAALSAPGSAEIRPGPRGLCREQELPLPSQLPSPSLLCQRVLGAPGAHVCASAMPKIKVWGKNISGTF